MNATDAQAETRRLVDKLWSYCDVLRDEGVSTIDYVEQLTFLLFLKIADEKADNPLAAETILPASWQGRGWQELQGKSGDELKQRYDALLEDLGSRPPGTPLNLIFGKAQNKVQNAANLSRLINDLIGKQNWSLQQPQRLLGHHHQQAAQLRPAHRQATRHPRPCGRCGAGQRAVRGRRGRDRAA